MTMKDEKATYQVVDGAIQDLKTAQRYGRSGVR